MADFNPEVVHQAFEKVKAKTGTDIRGIYNRIYQEVVHQPVEALISEIIIRESKYVNEYIYSLKSELKELSFQMIVDSGISRKVADGLWAGVTLTTKNPNVELCRKETVKFPDERQQKSSGSSAGKRKNAQEVDRLESNRNLAIGFAVAGGVAEAVSWLVVPGFSGLSIVVKVAGAVVIGAGVVNAINSQQEINRLTTEVRKTDQRTESSTKEIQQFILQVCENQSKCNTGHVSKWIDKICEALIIECREELS